LRLRTPNEIKTKDNKELKKASGINSNVFYQTVEVKKPIIAEKATIKPLAIAPTYLYDIKTEKGKSYSFLIK
jgi:alpha-L-fucosidase 2